MPSTAHVPQPVPEHLDPETEVVREDAADVEFVDEQAELDSARQRLRRSPVMAALTAMIVCAALTVFALGAVVLADSLVDPALSAQTWIGVGFMVAGVLMGLLTRKTDRRIVPEHRASGLAYSAVLGLGLLSSMIFLGLMAPTTDAGMQTLGSVFVTLAGVSLGEAAARVVRAEYLRAAVCVLTFFLLVLFSPITPWLWLCLVVGAVIGLVQTLLRR